MSEQEPAGLCRTCTWYGRFPLARGYRGYCRHLAVNAGNVRYLAGGNPMSAVEPRVARSSDGACKPQGLYWQRKTKVSP